MQEIDYEVQPIEYANSYKDIQTNGTDYLAYRDIPMLLKQHKASFSKVLDYGCGSGNSTKRLKELAKDHFKNFDIYGVDINSEMIKIVKDKDPKGKYIHIQHPNTTFPDNFFTLVFSSWVLVEISSKKKILALLNEIKRIMKPGALLIIVTCTEQFYSRNWLTIDTNFPENTDLYSSKRVKLRFKSNGLTIMDYYWYKQDYKSLFSKSGFTIVDIHEPLGFKTEQFAWKDELNFAPYTIYLLKQNESLNF